MPPGPHAGNRNRPAYSGQPRFRFPKQIVQLFAPRKPLEFKPPPRKRRLRPMTGLAHFTHTFSSTTTPTHATSLPSLTPPANNEGDATKKPTSQEDEKKRGTESKFETPAQQRLRVKREKCEHVTHIVRKARESWDPKQSPITTTNIANITTTTTSPATTMDITDTDTGANATAIASETGTTNNKADQSIQLLEKTKEPYNTIFVWNIPHTSIELRLQDEFESFGPVRTIVMPKNLKGFPRGYAFIEFEDERDADVAVRQADGMRFEGKRLKVDVERGRTVKGWFPNRLDGQFNSCAQRRR